MLLVEKWVNCEIIVGVPLLIKAIVLCIHEKWGNVEIIVGIPLLIKAIILGIQNILEVLLKDIGILKMESIFLHTNITIIPHSVLYVSLSYYIINPCTSASSNFDDSFS